MAAFSPGTPGPTERFQSGLRLNKKGGRRPKGPAANWLPAAPPTRISARQGRPHRNPGKSFPLLTCLLNWAPPPALESESPFRVPQLSASAVELCRSGPGLSFQNAGPGGTTKRYMPRVSERVRPLWKRPARGSRSPNGQGRSAYWGPRRHPGASGPTRARQPDPYRPHQLA